MGCYIASQQQDSEKFHPCFLQKRGCDTPQFKGLKNNIGDSSVNVGLFSKNVGDFPKNVGVFFRRVGGDYSIANKLLPTSGITHC